MEKGHNFVQEGRKANLLKEDISLPAAVIFSDLLERNLAWMQTFCDKRNVRFAPHAKTTMSPYIFTRQREMGAWGLTLATPIQIYNAYQTGAKNLLMANQLVGQANMRIISQLLSDEDVQFCCVVDSIDNVKQLADFFSAADQQIDVLIELGTEGGRCGCRSDEQVQQLVTEISKHHAVRLKGIEFYEGVIKGENPVNEVSRFIERAVDTTLLLLHQSAFDTDEVFLTGAGSAWYDVVADIISHAILPDNIFPVLRPGCYITHDEGIYQQAQDKVIERDDIAGSVPGQLLNCLEVWAYICSVPEPGKIIVNIGKRDIAFDAGYPKPIRHYRNQVGQKTEMFKWQVTGIMDQHLMIDIPTNSNVLPGDIVAFSQSHPCLTMDKWRQIHLVDYSFNLLDTIKTKF
ncbi:amino acid deaminase [Veronia pacifica]|nr:amino acid deaminase [Veronia pacifica]